VSPNFNREAGVIIAQPGVARYFLEVFEDDWSSSAKTPPITTDFLKLGVVVIVLALLIIIYYRRRRV
jgi:hypothetical protein